MMHDPPERFNIQVKLAHSHSPTLLLQQIGEVDVPGPGLVQLRLELFDAVLQFLELDSVRAQNADSDLGTDFVRVSPIIGRVC